VTVNPDDAVAPIDTLADPNDALDGCANVMFWLIDPTTIVCVMSLAALKFVLDAADAVTTQLPDAVKVTTPDEIEHGPDTANVGDTPDDSPVTFDTADAVGV